MRMAKSSPSWGYDRIQGAMANFGHKIAPNTVKRILKDHGIEPAVLRKKSIQWYAIFLFWNHRARGPSSTRYSGPRGAGPDCVRCHTRYASTLVPRYLIAAKYDGTKNRSPGDLRR